jgi:hypothetical protein
MAQPEDEEEQYLATLHELEATQEEIANYQGLLKDLPEIYERKFNERLKPVLDRQQHLLDERESLLQQLHHVLPGSESLNSHQPLDAAHQLSPTTEVADSPAPALRRRPWWLMGIAALGLTVGMQVNKQTAPDAAATRPSSTSSALESVPTEERPSTSSASASTLRGRVVERALEEWRFFDQPTLQNGTLLRVGRTEGDPGQWQRVITYWREGLQNESVTERSQSISNDHPWSAAFIAYVMKRSGVGDRFPYAASHSGSIKEAIYNRQHTTENASLVGHRVSDYTPRPGDLLCASRSWAIGKVTYENAGEFDFFPSRCELVIRASSHQVETIGGDLLDAVTRHIIPATNGRIAPQAAERWLVVIQTRID